MVEGRLNLNSFVVSYIRQLLQSKQTCVNEREEKKMQVLQDALDAPKLVPVGFTHGAG